MEVDEAAQPETVMINTCDPKPLQQQSLTSMVDKFCKDAQALKEGKQSQTTAIVEQALPRATASQDAESSEDDGGLEFVDPEAIKKAQQAEAAANKEQNQKPKMVMINGKMVPAATVSLN